MEYAGDVKFGNTINILFTTVDAAGVPTALVGGVIAAYVGNSLTQITAGITLSADHDGIVGLNAVTVVASTGNGYTANTDVSLVVTTGTVDGSSIVGYVIGSFSIENRVVNEVIDAPPVQDLVDAVWNEPRASHTTAGTFGQGAASVQGNVTGSVASVTGAVGSVTGNVGGNVVGSVASVVGAVGSVTGAVGSVTGNVGGNVTGNVNGSVASVTANVNADVKKINGTTVNGNGAGTPWGP